MEGFEAAGKKRIAALMYICFVITGMLSVSVGSLIPILLEVKSGIGYYQAGLLVSIYAVGNLFANLGFGYISEKMGIKNAILAFDLLFPLSYILIICGDGFFLISLAFLMMGLSRGACSNCCNYVINLLYPGNAAPLNGLHAVYSFGAFAFPLLLTSFTHLDPQKWIYPCMIMTILGCIGMLLFALCPQILDSTDIRAEDTRASGKYGFFRERLFWATTLTLFFYLSAESGILGWMVTYFTDTGYISKELSQLTASVLWIMILSGRTLTAYLSDKIDKKKLLGIMGLGLTVFFTALLFVRNSVSIIIIVMCIGFFASGIFPTSLSFAGELSKRYRLSFSYILTIAGIGAVLMPSIVGYIADIKGIIYGMASVGAAVLLDLICIALLSRSSLYPH